MAQTNLEGDYNLRTPRPSNSPAPRYLVNGNLISAISINEESDFPVQDATTITLEASKCYLLLSGFTTAKNFTVENGACFTAGNLFGPVLTYSGTGNMFNGTASFQITSITVSCPNAQAFSWIAASAGVGIFLGINISVASCTKFGTFNNLQAVDISGSNSPDADDGMSFIGANILVASIRQVALISTSVTFKGLDYGTAVIPNIEALNLIFIGPSGSFGLSGLVDSGNVTVGSLAMISNSSFSGGMTDLENITVDDVRWQFRDNSPTRDTEANALVFLLNNTTETVISVVNTPVLIAGTFTVQKESIFDGNAAGRVTYKGEKPITAKIFTTMTATTASGGAKDVTFFVTKNGTVVTDSGISNNVKLNIKGNSTMVWQEDLVKDDFIEIFVENNDDTVNVTVEDMNLSLSG